jgi:hypothetical protein
MATAYYSAAIFDALAVLVVIAAIRMRTPRESAEVVPAE